MKKKWHKPSHKWGERKKTISILFPPLRLAAIDEYCQAQSTPEVKVTRSMVLNDALDKYPAIRDIEVKLLKEAALAKIDRDHRFTHQ